MLAVEITPDGFEWALARACLSHYDPGLHADRRAWARSCGPARYGCSGIRSGTLRLEPLPYRSLQVGLGWRGSRPLRRTSGSSASPTSRRWPTRIHDLLRAGDDEAARAMLVGESPYPLPRHTAKAIGASPVREPPTEG